MGSLASAGAGTGKTNTLAHRVAHLVLNKVQPDRILLLTFSRRAAQEMTRRAERILGKAKQQQQQQPIDLGDVDDPEPVDLGDIDKPSTKPR